MSCPHDMDPTGCMECARERRADRDGEAIVEALQRLRAVGREAVAQTDRKRGLAHIAECREILRDKGAKL